MEGKYSLPGFYPQELAQEHAHREATLRLLEGRIEAEELTVGFSGGGACLRGAVVRLLLRLLRRRSAAVRSLLWARAACVEKRAREKGERWHCEEEGTARGPIYRLGRPAHVTD